MPARSILAGDAMTDGCFWLFIVLTGGLGLFIVAIIWDDRSKRRPPKHATPYTLRCLWGSGWPTDSAREDAERMDNDDD